MLNIQDPEKSTEPVNKVQVTKAEVVDTGKVNLLNEEKVISNWRTQNRNYIIALQALCVLLGIVLTKLAEHLIK